MSDPTTTRDRRVFGPVKINSLTLRNRTIRSAAFEGMSPGGRVSDALINYHREVSAGGIGMTTLAYASVSRDGLTYPHQLNLQQDEVVPGLRRATDAIHKEGAAACIQIGHAGSFAAKSVTGTHPRGPSVVFNIYNLNFPRRYTEAELQALAAQFARGARLCQEAGFDAIELQAGHGYLLSQFLSPYTNRRDDPYGGCLTNRLRFPLQVLAAVRKAVGASYPVLVKMNLKDGFAGGLELAEAVEVARAFEQAGADALILSGGFVSKVPMYIMRGEVPYREFRRGQTSLAKKVGIFLIGRLMVKAFPFEEAYFLTESRAIRKAVKIPLSLIGGLRSLAKMEAVVTEGFELLSMARPLIMEPDLIRRMQRGEASTSKCEPCNKCIAEMDKGHMRCVLLEERAARY